MTIPNYILMVRVVRDFKQEVKSPNVTIMRKSGKK